MNRDHTYLSPRIDRLGEVHDDSHAVISRAFSAWCKRRGISTRQNDLAAGVNSTMGRASEQEPPAW